MKPLAIAAGITLAAASAPVLAQASIYKCVSAAGVAYQSFPGQGCRKMPAVAEGTVTVLASSGGSGTAGSGASGAGTAGGRSALSFGMSRDTVAARWGVPEDVTRTLTRQGTAEQWVYDGGKRILTFQNGALETIQQ